MSNNESTPRRLRIKRHCSIDGIREGRRMKAGLYILGQNLTEDEARLLVSPQFSHCVEILDDVPAVEALASDAELPAPEPGYTYQKRRELAATRAKLEREKGNK